MSNSRVIYDTLNNFTVNDVRKTQELSSAEAAEIREKVRDILAHVPVTYGDLIFTELENKYFAQHQSMNWRTVLEQMVEDGELFTDGYGAYSQDLRLLVLKRLAGGRTREKSPKSHISQTK